MRKITSLLFTLLALSGGGRTFANVSITAPVNGVNLSADKAANATPILPWTTLTSIAISEGAGKADIATTAAGGATFILTAPTGWEFNPGFGSVSFSLGKDITSATIGVSSSTITITYASPTANSNSDVLTISNIQVRALDGAALSASGVIFRATGAAGGTAGTFAGVTTTSNVTGSGGTSFGGLSQVVGAAAKLSFQVQPSTAVAGVAISPAVKVRIDDQFNNATTGTATVVVAIGNNAGAGTLSGTTSIAAVAGVATFSNLSINKSGTGYTLAATSGSLAGTSAAFDINSAAASKLAFSVAPSNSTAGAVVAPAITVTVLDALNNVVASTANVTLAIGTNPGGGTLGGTVTQAAVAGVATFSDLSINKSGTGYTLTASSSGLTGATSGAFNIAVGAPAQLVFGQQPATTTAGQVISPAVTVRIVDAQSNLTASTANVTISVVGAPLTSGTATVAAVGGVATFGNLVINQAGTGYTLKANGASLPEATSSAFNINPAAANVLVFSTQPGGGTAGGTLSPQPVVRTKDLLGNYSTVNLPTTLIVTVSISSGTGTLLGTTSLALGSGAATPGTASFSNLQINASGNKVLTAAANSFVSAVSDSLTISPATMSGFTVSGYPTTTTTGTSDDFTVTAVDSFGNTSSSYVGTATFTLSDLAATPPAPYTFQVSDAGAKTLKAKFQTVGTWSITATDGAFTGTQSGITVIAPVVTVADASMLASTAANAVTPAWTTLTGPVYQEPAIGAISTGTVILNAPAGFEFDTGGTAPTIKIDGNGTAAKNINNTATGSSVAVSRTSSNVTFTVTSSSSSPGTANKLTWQNIRVRPTSTSPLATGVISKTGTATMTGVTPGTVWGTLTETPTALDHFAFAPISSPQTAGIAFTVGITAKDQYNNTVPTFTGTVGLTATAGTVTPATSSAFTAGTLSQSVSISAGGLSQILTATQTAGTASGASASFTVNKQTQSITFGVITDRTYGDADFTVSAGASPSSLPVSFSILSGPATILGNTVHLTGAGLVTVTASQAGDETFSAATDVNQPFTVAQASLTPQVTAAGKIYDGTIVAQVTGGSVSVVIGSDDVSLTGGTGSFADKNIGLAKVVTVTGLSLAGAQAGNYQLTSTTAQTSADITSKALTVTGVTASNKEYDGNTTATLDVAAATLQGAVLGDDVALDSTSHAGQFADAEVGAAKVVTVSGLALTGGDLGNYTLGQPTTTADITKAVSTTLASAAQVTFSVNSQPVALDATVTATTTVGEGAVLFTVKQNDTVIGSALSANVAAGAAATSYTLPANLAPGTYTIHADYTGVDRYQDSSSTATLTVVDTLAQWRTDTFSAQDLADPSKEATVWGDEADPDGDKRSNLMEYALGLDPLAGADAGDGISSAVVEDTGSSYNTLTFKHRLNDPGLTYVVEVSADKLTWTTATDIVATVPIDAEFELLTVRDSTAVPEGSARLVRLRVVKN